MNKELSAKYEKLVNDAPEFIKGLPWGKDFEVDVFKKPDFTALEVLTFATGGELFTITEGPVAYAINYYRYPGGYQRTSSYILKRT